jgi:hypothetical protein
MWVWGGVELHVVQAQGRGVVITGGLELRLAREWVGINACAMARF